MVTASKVILRKIKIGLVNVLLFHIVRVVGDVLIPNLHLGNRLRGLLYKPFLGECGRRFAIASGCIINGAWNMKVGDDVYIAHRCWINAIAGLSLGDGVILSPNVVVTTTAHGRENGGVSLRTSKQSPVRIGAGGWIASNSVVTRGSVVGPGVIVGACSVVGGELEGNSLYAGNPVQFIRIIPD